MVKQKEDIYDSQFYKLLNEFKENEQIIKEVIYELNGTLSPKCLKLIFYGNKNWNIEEIVDDYNVKLDNEYLNVACRYGKLQDIQYMLDAAKLNVTRSNFRLIFIKPYCDYYYAEDAPDDDDDDLKYYPDDEVEINEDIYFEYYDTYWYAERWENKNRVNDKMEILFNHGYVPNYEDLKYAIEHKFPILDIDRFDIDYDEEDLLKICSKNQCFPDYNFKKINKEMLQLRKLCAMDTSIIKIRAHLKKHKLVPDKACMEFACAIYQKGKLIDVLVEYGGILTDRCIIDIVSNSISVSQSVKNVINIYKKQHYK